MTTLKKFLTLTLNLLALIGSSQIRYEKGYFIDNNGSKTECLILNRDWKNNPDRIKYKMTGESQPETVTIETMREFAVAGSKYSRQIVDMDRSSNTTSKLSSRREPDFEKETLLLRHLIEGEANLYMFEEGNLVRFFYKIDTTEIIPLVHKKYRHEKRFGYYEDNRKEVNRIEIRSNDHYKQQLRLSLICDDLSLKDAENLNYRKADLIQYFTRFNQCADESWENDLIAERRKLVNFYLRSGVKLASLDVKGSRPTSFDPKVGFVIGGEFEVLLPFNNNKWAILVVTNYQTYEDQWARSGLSVIRTAEYHSLEFQFGGRHYFFLNESSKLQLNLTYVLDLPMNSEVVSLPVISSTGSLNIGFGYVIKNRFGLTGSYTFNRNILNEYLMFSSDYRYYSLVFSYRLL